MRVTNQISIIKILVLSILIAVIVSCNDSAKYSDQPLRHVGDILHDPKLDTTDFKPCNEQTAWQYYNFSDGINYRGEKIAIVRAFESEFHPVRQDLNVYVTIRFMVNCQGQTGRFRLVQMNENYEEISPDKNLTSRLLDVTRSLDGWEVGYSDGQAHDYYQYLTFKINNGKIEDILP